MEETDGRGPWVAGRSRQFCCCSTNAATESLLVSSVSEHNVHIGSSLSSTCFILLRKIHPGLDRWHRQAIIGSGDDDARVSVDTFAAAAIISNSRPISTFTTSATAAIAYVSVINERIRGLHERGSGGGSSSQQREHQQLNNNVIVAECIAS